MTAREVLDGINTQLAAATPGPWKAQNLEAEHDHYGIYWVSVDRPDERKTVAEVDANDDGVEAVWRFADAEFIAAAPGNIARLTEALTAVLDLHQPITHHFLTPPAGSVEVCHSCREEYPCPTVAAIENALKP